MRLSNIATVLVHGRNELHLKFNNDADLREAYTEITERMEKGLPPYKEFNVDTMWEDLAEARSRAAAPAVETGNPLPVAPKAELSKPTFLEMVADYDRRQALVAPKAELVIINGEPATAHSMLAALIDIYDDAQNNAPEHRCYVESAWSDALKDARQFLATPQPVADRSAEAKGPLSDDQISDLVISWNSIGGNYADLIREVERMHGIAAMGTPQQAEQGSDRG